MRDDDATATILVDGSSATVGAVDAPRERRRNAPETAVSDLPTEAMNGSTASVTVAGLLVGAWGLVRRLSFSTLLRRLDCCRQGV